jgi:transketolase
MARGTPDQVAQKWRDRLSGATTEITQGVNNVSVSPGQLAAAQADVWVANTTASRDKWKARTAAVTLEEWRNKMITVGIPRVASGAQANVGKVQAFLADFLPFQDRITAQVRSMPRGTLEQNIARATQQMRLTAGYKRGANG